KELNFNAGVGVLRVGRRANTSIGRFLRIYIRNVCGFRIPPGETEKSGISHTFNVVLAEEEDTVRDIGWPTFAVDRGFGPDENVVTVFNIIASSPPLSGWLGDDLPRHLNNIADTFGKGTYSFWSYPGARSGIGNPLIVMS